MRTTEAALTFLTFYFGQARLGTRTATIVVLLWWLSRRHAAASAFILIGLTTIIRALLDLRAPFGR